MFQIRKVYVYNVKVLDQVVYIAGVLDMLEFFSAYSVFDKIDAISTNVLVLFLKYVKV